MKPTFCYKMFVNVLCVCVSVYRCVGGQSDNSINSEKQLKLPFTLTLEGIPSM